MSCLSTSVVIEQFDNWQGISCYERRRIRVIVGTWTASTQLQLSCTKLTKLLSYYFSVPPSIVRSSQKQKLVAALPLSNLLLETDSPALGPNKNEDNQPSNAYISAQEIARLKNIEVSEVVGLAYILINVILFQYLIIEYRSKSPKKMLASYLALFDYVCEGRIGDFPKFVAPITITDFPALLVANCLAGLRHPTS